MDNGLLIDACEESVCKLPKEYWNEYMKAIKIKAMTT